MIGCQFDFVKRNFVVNNQISINIVFIEVLV